MFFFFSCSSKIKIFFWFVYSAKHSITFSNSPLPAEETFTSLCALYSLSETSWCLTEFSKSKQNVSSFVTLVSGSMCCLVHFKKKKKKIKLGCFFCCCSHRMNASHVLFALFVSVAYICKKKYIYIHIYI